MKNHLSYFGNRFILILAILSMHIAAIAQVDVDIDLGKEEWYENPVYWLLGGVILILLVLLARRKR